MLTGVLMALLASLGWAISSVIIKFLTDKIDTITINTIRLWVGVSVLLLILAASDELGSLYALSTESILYIISSGVLAMAIGDTIYIKSLSLLDASIAFPIAQCAFVLLTTIGAIMLLGESYSLLTFTGGGLILWGIYLITVGSSKTTGDSQRLIVNRKGVPVAIVAAAAWAVATLALKTGSVGGNAIAVSVIRTVSSALVLTLVALPRLLRPTPQTNQFSTRNILLVVAAGLSTYGLASVSYVLALQMIGAGKTAILITSSPLLALPFAIFFLKEKPTRKTLLGMMISTVGVVLVVI